MDDPTAVVRRYFEAMAAHDWNTLATTLDPDVERLGPYGDDVHGVDAYAPFLRATIEALEDYVLRVDRVVAVAPAVVLAELSETVTLGGKRLETPEALVFDLSAAGRIARVAVYLRKSFTPA